MNLPQKIYNLAACLDLLERYDNEDEDLSQINPELTIEEIKESVDAIYFGCEKAKAIMARYDELAKSMQSRKKLIEKNLEWLEDTLRTQMTGRFQKLPGKFVRVQLNAGRDKVEMLKECDQLLASLYPGCVRISYQWDKDVIKQRIVAGEVLTGIAELATGRSIVRFYPIDLKGANNVPKDLPANP